MNESSIPVLVHGGLATSKSFEELLAILSPSFPRASIGESSHYEGGRYVRIEYGDGERLCFERCSGTEYLISGDADDPEEVLGLVEQLAKVLEAANLIHRLEVYRDEEFLGGTAYRWEEASVADQAPMVVVSQYTRIEDAQKDAARLSKRGIRTAIVHGGGGGLIAGTGPSLELHVDARDMEKMSGMEDEIADEIASERPYECPKCQSKNYTPRQPASETIFGFLSALLRGRAKTFDDYLHYRCGDCGCYFRVKVA